MFMDHIFIDLAVTTPDPFKGEVVAIAAVRTDRKGNVLAAFSEKILENGEKDFDEKKFKRVIENLSACLLKGKFESSYVVVACHADIDRAFLKRSWERVTETEGEIFKGRAWLDILQLAWPLAYNDMIAERSLESLSRYCGVENVEADTATGDCEALVRVYWATMKRYRVALLGEEVVRDVGGDMYNKAIEWVNGLIG